MLKCGLSAMFSKKHIASCNLLQCENTMSRVTDVRPTWQSAQFTS